MFAGTSERWDEGQADERQEREECRDIDITEFLRPDHTNDFTHMNRRVSEALVLAANSRRNARRSGCVARSPPALAASRI